MEREIALLLKQYARSLGNLDDPYGLGVDEVLLVDLLSTRDALYEAELSDAERERLFLLDSLLLKHWNVFGDLLPLVLEHSRARWWWFLNEGPQVREQAKTLDSEPAQA